MLYFYVPLFLESDGVTTSLGEDDGAGGIVYSEPTPSSRVLHLDEGVPRFVWQVPNGTAARPGWIQKTVAQINTDYPGLI
tara:strand:- start:1673 stop:1912 length:240 start_codon:yes stop_codon:yes gene_type:complete